MSSTAATTAAHDRLFRTDHLRKDLKGRTVRSGAVTIATQAASRIVALSSTAVLARLLTPADFGLILMVTALTGFANNFLDGGLSVAAIREPRLNHAQASTLFWLNIVLGAVATVIFAALAPLVAWFYGQPELVWVTLALSATMLLSGVNVQHGALLKRQMRFKALGAVQLTAQVIGAGVSIALALGGAGYWSLVAGWIAVAGSRVVLAWWASGWRPGPPRRGAGVRPMVGFGAYMSGTALLSQVARHLDNVLIGWAAGPIALGLYSKAYSLLLLPIRQINGPAGTVAVPALSSLQTDPQRFRRFYRRGMEMIAFLSTPVVAVLFVTADEVVLTILGPQWTEAVWLFRLLAPAALMAATNVATPWVNIPLGQGRRQLSWMALATAVRIAAMVIGLRWGAAGVAAGISIASVSLKLPGLWYACRGTPVGVGDFLAVMWRAMLAALAAGAALWWVEQSWLGGLGPAALRLAVMLPAYGLLYGAAFIALPGGWGRLWTMLGTVRELRAQRGGGRRIAEGPIGPDDDPEGG